MVAIDGLSPHYSAWSGCLRPKGSDWLKDNVATPAYNAFADEVWNPAANLTNAVSQVLCHQDVAGKLQDKPLSAVGTISIENAARLAVGGVVGAVTYSLCARAAGLGLGSAARGMELEGFSAKLLGSERSALVVGAALHDACKDAPDARTRATNALAGASSFYCFDVGNTFASQLKNKLAYYPTLALTGAVGSVVSNVVSGRHDTNYGRSAVESAALNVFFPGTHELFAKAADHVNVNGLRLGDFTMHEGGRGVALERYRRTSRNEGVSPTLDQLSDRYFLTRVQPSELGNSINTRSGVINLERPCAEELGHELAHKRATQVFERDMQHAASLLSTDSAGAKSAYVNTRIQQEQFARGYETQIAKELNHTNEHATSTETLAAYRPIFEKEFETFAASNGRWRPESDYILLSSQERERLRREDRPSEYLSALYPEMTEAEKVPLCKVLESWKQGNDDRNSYDLIYGMRMTAWRQALTMSLAEEYISGLRIGKTRDAVSIFENHDELSDFRERVSDRVNRFADAYGQIEAKQKAIETQLAEARSVLEDAKTIHEALLLAADIKLQKQQEIIHSDFGRELEPWQQLRQRREDEVDRASINGWTGLTWGSEFGRWENDSPEEIIQRYYSEKLEDLQCASRSGMSEDSFQTQLKELLDQQNKVEERLRSARDSIDQRYQRIASDYDQQAKPLEALRDSRLDEAQQKFTARKELLKQRYERDSASAQSDIEDLSRKLNQVRAQKSDEIMLLKKAVMPLCNNLGSSTESIVANLPADRGLSSEQAKHALSIALLLKGDTPQWWNSNSHWLDPTFGRSIRIPLLPKESVDSLRNFWKKNLRQNPEKLEEIALGWDRLSPVQQSELEQTNFSDAGDLLRALQRYPNAQSFVLARESAKHQVPIKLYSDIEARFLKSQNIPEAFSTDDSHQSGNLQGYFLKRSDPRALYLGHYTNSCMHVDGKRRSGTWWNQESPDGGFFVVEDTTDGDIVAASRVWKVPYEDEKAVCFNNIESKGVGARNNQILGLYEQAAHALLGTDGIKLVTVGEQATDLDIGNLPTAEQPAPLPKSLPKNSWVGCHKQRVLALSSSLPRVISAQSQSQPPAETRSQTSQTQPSAWQALVEQARMQPALLETNYEHFLRVMRMPGSD